MNIRQAIKFLDKQVPNPSLGLPEEVFLFVSRMTPLVNVDLLINDEDEKILLSWRDDKFDGKGWHIPGGILRFKESLEKRIKKVAEIEIGTVVKFDPVPIAINQVICSQNDRGHFISLLYKCFLSKTFIPTNTGLKKTDNGYLQWHDSFPKNLIKIQKKIYKSSIDKDDNRQM